MVAALEISGLKVLYGQAIEALDGVSITVPDGGFVALLGANGAGKSTTLKMISGLLRFENGRIAQGTIKYRGEDIAAIPSYQLARRGILHVREGRFVFPTMTVEENLEASLFARGKRGPALARRVYEEVFHYFPALKERAKSQAGYLSGGEQQMLAIGRGMMAEPELLILDEPSIGLSPLLVEEMFALIRRLNEDGLTILLVEQNVLQSLEIAARAFVMENGEIKLSGTPAEMMDDPELQRSYLGLA